MSSKIIEYTDLSPFVKRIAGKKTVLVGGSFDILHFGHLTFLKNAKKAGDVLIVMLESDEFARKRKHKVPVHTQEQRAEILSEMQSVDYVLKLPYLETHAAYFDLVNKLKPSIIGVTEGDTRIDKKTEQAKLVGAEVKVVSPQLKSFSSSQIVSYESIFSD